MNNIHCDQKLQPWAKNPKDIGIGIEQEHFIFKGSEAPCLEDIKTVFAELCDGEYHVRASDSDNRPLAVNHDMAGGYIAIKNDFCTHILEVSLPPLKSVVTLSNIYNDTWGMLDAVLKKHGIHRKLGGSLSSLPENWETVPSKRLEWFKSRSTSKPTPEYWHRDFGAFICSTQIHLNVLDENFYEFLPKLYSFEYLTPLLFSNSHEFNAKNAHCVRPLVYRDNYPSSYIANAYPKKIPSCKKQYEQMISSTKDFIRDYTFIAPRRFGSIEFRAACSQDDFSQIMELAALKVAGFVAASASEHTHRTQMEQFYDVCRSGEVDQAILLNDFAELVLVAEKLPVCFRDAFEKLSGRVGGRLGR